MDEAALIREIACVVRGQIGVLATGDPAAADARLAAVLNAPAVDPERLLDVLESDAGLHRVAAEALAAGSPALASLAVVRSAGLPGHGDPDFLPTRFACPEADFVWYRRSVGGAPPACPTHGAVLVADRQQ
ncbi:hypothetical protein [Symbioplanes lichenis]|uniref:hypothetical protein n=1 Tax=Symbioplanes lichenis TaxID=1629072 RepID=UPI00273966D0|nr:hypothetical protein [Actinoplanes lichenis]